MKPGRTSRQSQRDYATPFCLLTLFIAWLIFNVRQKMTTNLKGIDLPESFVLGWNTANARLVFQIEFALWPESSFYRQPREDEWTCFRRGVLVFERITIIEGLKKQEDVRYGTDASGERDYGNVDIFEEKDGGVKLSGAFGDVSLRCGAWHLEFHDEEA
jgi:hypothetical protein